MANKSDIVLAVVAIIVFAAYLWPWYNFVEPRLFGIPFFYWWIIVMYVVTTALLLAYTATTREEAKGGV